MYSYDWRLWGATCIAMTGDCGGNMYSYDWRLWGATCIAMTGDCGGQHV